MSFVLVSGPGGGPCAHCTGSTALQDAATPPDGGIAVASRRVQPILAVAFGAENIADQVRLLDCPVIDSDFVVVVSLPVAHIPCAENLSISIMVEIDYFLIMPRVTHCHICLAPS